jgi:quaternary ammonium compound-resistance protein SugE
MNMTLTNFNPWLLLFAAGLLEIVWAISLKASDGYSRLSYTAVTIVGPG